MYCDILLSSLLQRTSHLVVALWQLPQVISCRDLLFADVTVAEQVGAMATDGVTVEALWVIKYECDVSLIGEEIVRLLRLLKVPALRRPRLMDMTSVIPVSGK